MDHKDVAGLSRSNRRRSKVWLTQSSFDKIPTSAIRHMKGLEREMRSKDGKLLIGKLRPEAFAADCWLGAPGQRNVSATGKFAQTEKLCRKLCLVIVAITAILELVSPMRCLSFSSGLGGHRENQGPHAGRSGSSSSSTVNGTRLGHRGTPTLLTPANEAIE